MLTDVCPAGCRAILSRNKKRRATLSASYFGQLKAAGYLSWQPAPHKMGEGIRNPYGEQRTDSNRPSSRRPRTRPQMGTGVVSFHVFSKLERRTRHATAGCLIPCKPAVRLAVKRLARLGPWAKATHLPPDAYLVMAAGAGAAARMRSRSP